MSKDFSYRKNENWENHLNYSIVVFERRMCKVCFFINSFAKADYCFLMKQIYQISKTQNCMSKISFFLSGNMKTKRIDAINLNLEKDWLISKLIS